MTLLLLLGCSGVLGYLAEERIADRRALEDAQGACEEVCSRSAEDCGEGNEQRCVSDCLEDSRDCPSEMLGVLDCHLVEGIVCDTGQDQGIGEEGCEAEHDAVHDCGHDPF